MRHIGLDLGTTNSSVCYTRYNDIRHQFEDPEPVRIGSAPTVRSLLLLDKTGQQIVDFGESVYKNPDYFRHPERVYEEFKMALGEKPKAALCTELLCQQLMSGLQHVFNLNGPPPESNFRTAVGAPARWVKEEPQRLELIRRAVETAGFPAIEVVPEPVAAMLYHAFLGDIGFERRAQRWLVIDFGGGTTDLAVVETAGGGKQPRILSTFGRPYGGKDFDNLLLEQHILPHHWRGAAPEPYQRLELLRKVRQFKEKFSQCILDEQDAYKSRWRIRGVINPVGLTREQFESDALAASLIARFTAILLDGFRGSGLGLRDVERVILTGGSARWYFVRQAAESLFGPRSVVISANPELTIAKGLALATTDFKMPVQKEEPAKQLPVQAKPAPMTATRKDSPPVEVSQEMNIMIDQASNIEAKHLNLRQCRRRAMNVINKYAMGGTALTFVIAPIPLGTQLPLTAMETRLVNEIGKIYGYSLKGEELITVVGGLLAGSTLLKVGVMEAASFVPGLGWAVKAGVAGGAIKLLGETTIHFFENRRRQELSLTGNESKRLEGPSRG